MSLTGGFRLSFYISLALACLCLFLGEWDFLPSACALVPIILGLMVVAYHHEGVWHLGVDAANRLGAAIGIVTLLWVIYKAPRANQELATGEVPWPAALLPLLAPLLPVLLVVKLFRPKTLTDFWVFQTISLITVTLSCILAGDIWFFLLLVLFLGSLFWCLTLFFLYKQRFQHDGVALNPKKAWLFAKQPDAVAVPAMGIPGAVELVPVPWPYLGTRRAGRWTLTIVGLGLVLFFLMPRFSDFQWVPTKLTSTNRVVFKTGISEDMDLVKEGVVELSKEKAFEVIAMDKNGPGPLLPADQRWLLQVLDFHEKGKWETCQKSSIFPILPLKNLPYESHFDEEPAHPSSPPSLLADNQVYLHFKVHLKSAGGIGVALPISAPNEVGFHPHVGDVASKSPFLQLVPESDTFATKSVHRRSLLQYGQIFVPATPGLEQPVRDVSPRYHAYLLNQSVPGGIQAWTRNLLDDLDSLDNADLVRDDHNRLPPDKHAKIARALSDYLAGSGRFIYSLKLRHFDRTIDPIEDFLLNIKEGHCERYAAALTLMLRSLDIPARVVKGYMGAYYEPTFKDGKGVDRLVEGRHVIRQDQAHSWVQVLVPGKEKGTWNWLVLDPTPSVTEDSRAFLPMLEWMWTQVKNPSLLWKGLVMDYGTDKQKDTFQAVWTNLTPSRRQRNLAAELWQSWRLPLLLLSLAAACLVGGWYWRRTRQPAPRIATVLSFHASLLRVLAKYCHLQPRSGQTSLEFARLASAALAARALAESLTRLPEQTVAVLYRQSFGGHEAAPEECRHLQEQVQCLEAALRRAPAGAVSWKV